MPTLSDPPLHPGTPPVTVRDLYNALRTKAGLEWIAGRNGSERSLQGTADSNGNQSLIGPLNCIHPNLIQLLGRAELAYFTTLERSGYQELVNKLFATRPAAILLAAGIEVDSLITERAEKSDTPLLCSPLQDNALLDEAQYYLAHALARRETVHGVFMEVLGTGVLLQGAAAAGKSELALELISRGHRLIADDAPEFARIAPDIVTGSCPPLLRDFIEVRGLGILNIRAMFGDSAIKQQQYLQLVIQLQRSDDRRFREIDRLQGSYSTCNMLGLEIPAVSIPVAPGREIAILVEVAVRQYTLQQNGYDATREFIARQQQLIDGGGNDNG